MTHTEMHEVFARWNDGELDSYLIEITRDILAYEEKYGTGREYPKTLERDLSALGEILESRFVLEDQLIAGLHNRHRSKLGDAKPTTA